MKAILAYALKALGLIMTIGSVALSLYWAISSRTNQIAIFVACGFAILVGLVFLFFDTIIEIYLAGIGHIKKRAEREVQAIEKLKEETELKIRELEALMKFMRTFSAAQMEDREAWDQLGKWQHDESFPFSAQARDAWFAITDDHTSPNISVVGSFSWSDGVNKNTLSLSELRKTYERLEKFGRPALIQCIFEREDIPKRERMDFLVEVLGKEKYLRAVQFAGILFARAADLRLPPLAIGEYQQWWQENKGKF